MKKIVSLMLALAMILALAATAAAESSFTPANYEWSFVKKIPMKPKYSEACDQNGTIEHMTYTTHNYALEAIANGEITLEGKLPEGVEVIGIRTRGLWGSIWSRKGRSASPKFIPTLLKSVFLWFFVAPFAPRRKVTMHVEDLTVRAKDWSQLTRLEFNRELENWYNTQR